MLQQTTFCQHWRGFAGGQLCCGPFSWFHGRFFQPADYGAAGQAATGC